MSSNSDEKTASQMNSFSEMTDEEKKLRFGSHVDYGTRAYLAAQPYDQLYLYLELKKDPAIDLTIPLKVLLNDPKKTSSKLSMYHNNLTQIIQSYGSVKLYVELPVYVMNTSLMIIYVFVHILKAVPYYSTKLWGGDNVLSIRAVIQELYCRPIALGEPADSPNADGNITMTVEYNSKEFNERVTTLQRLLNKEALKKAIMYVVENGAESIPMAEEDKGWLLQKFKLFLENVVKKRDEKSNRFPYRDAVTKVIDERVAKVEYAERKLIPVVTYFSKTTFQTKEQCDWSKWHKYYRPAATKIPLGQIFAKDYTIFHGLKNGGIKEDSVISDHASTNGKSAEKENLPPNEGGEIDGATNGTQTSGSAATRKSTRQCRKTAYMDDALDSDSDSSADAVLNPSKKTRPNGSGAHGAEQGGTSKITGSVDHSHSVHIPETAVTVLTSAALKMIESVSKSIEQSVNPAKTDSEHLFSDSMIESVSELTEQNVNPDTTDGECLISENMIESVSESTGQNVNPDTTDSELLISENSEFDESTLQVLNPVDEMPLSIRMGLPSAKETLSQKKLSSSQSPIEQTKNQQKRSSASMPSSEETPSKRARKSPSRTEMIIQTQDVNSLLHKISKQVNLEQILEVYKGNRTEEELERETSRILCHRHGSVSSSPSKVLCLQNTLLQLSQMYDSNDFAEVVFKTISDQLDASKVLNTLNVDDLTGALLQKLTVNELLDLSQKRDSSFVREEVLRSASANDIINHLSTKNDWDDSAPLQILLEGISRIVLNESNLDLEEIVGTLINTTASIVKSKKYIKSTKKLFNVVLQNGLEAITDETKKILKDVVLKKFNRIDVVQLFNEILLQNDVINID